MRIPTLADVPGYRITDPLYAKLKKMCAATQVGHVIVDITPSLAREMLDRNEQEILSGSL